MGISIIGGSSIYWLRKLATRSAPCPLTAAKAATGCRRMQKLAVPNSTIFIAQLSAGTRHIIREDLEQHARENGYRLEWDWEAKDYVGMTRRFCDIDEIYQNTKLIFCERGEDIEAFELSKRRNIMLVLPDDDIDALCKKAGKYQLTVSQLIENFISDLIEGSKTNGSDERMYAQQWFERCWFSTLSEKTFLSYLIGFDRIDSVIEMWEELQDYKRQDALDEYDKEEMEVLQEELEEMFEDYKEWYSESADTTLQEGMKKVVAWSKEREELMNGSKNIKQKKTR